MAEDEGNNNIDSGTIAENKIDKKAKGENFFAFYFSLENKVFCNSRIILFDVDEEAYTVVLNDIQISYRNVAGKYSQLFVSYINTNYCS